MDQIDDTELWLNLCFINMVKTAVLGFTIRKLHTKARTTGQRPLSCLVLLSGTQRAEVGDQRAQTTTRRGRVGPSLLADGATAASILSTSTGPRQIRKGCFTSEVAENLDKFEG